MLRCRAVLWLLCFAVPLLQVFDPSPGSEERVVALSSTEDALSPYCAAQDGLIRCVIALTAGMSWAQWLLHAKLLASSTEATPMRFTTQLLPA
jgi:hypothetical protein